MQRIKTLIRRMPITIGALFAALSLAITLALIRPAVAQPTSKEDTLAQAAGRFAEKTFPALADSFEVPGAVLAVVGQAGMLALNGYGYADLAAQQPADPEQTLFRVASVSKPVTATAVLKLWERGAFDLHANINRYLGRTAVPEAFGAPVTAHGLLTHTAGFDEQLFGSGAPEAPDLAAYLRATLPQRVYPPGLLHSYSNHGYGLLGVLTEDVTGSSFAEVVDRMTFAPLGMMASTFQQPPPFELRERLATGYHCAGDECVPLPYDYVAFAPAGALQTTAADMARFMAFHLSGIGSALADSTRRRMHGPRWQPHPGLGGMGYGFYRGMVGRYEALRHAGGWPGWSSQLVLVSEVGLGYFVAVNTDAAAFMEALLEQFAADVLGGPLSPPTAGSPDVLLDRYAGTYRLARHAHRGVDKLAVLAGLPMPDLHVEVQGDSALALATGETRERLYPAGPPGVFVRPGLDPRRYYFETGTSGTAVRIHTDYASLERIPWWATQEVSAWTLTLCLVAFASAAGAWLLSLLRRRAVPPGLRRARTLAAAAAACHLLFALGLTGALTALGPQEILHPLPLWVRALFALPLAGAAFGVVTLPATFRVWHRGLGPVWTRLHYTAVAVAAVAVIPLLAYWNLLSFQF